jgi:hypothetical protein
MTSQPEVICDCPRRRFTSGLLLHIAPNRSTLPIPIQPRNSIIPCLLPFPVPRLILTFPASSSVPSSSRLSRNSLVTLVAPCSSTFVHLCFHGLTNCFSRKPFVLITICVAPWFFPKGFSTSDVRIYKRTNSFIFILLQVLRRREKSHLHWNQQLVGSFSKTPGVGVGLHVAFLALPNLAVSAR